MSASDDEDDFLSADEEGFGENDELKASACDDSKQDLKPVEQTKKNSGEEASKADSKRHQNDEEVIEKKKPNTQIVQKGQNIKHSEDSKGDVAYDDVKKTEGSSDSSNVKKDTSKYDAEDDEEEAILERVRERNLRIARTFSAEIAKNIKASAPIPVRGAKQIDDADYSNNLESGSIPNPPPPTPALSSSFNSEETSTSGTTQYSWRVPSMQRAKNPDTSTPELGKSEQTSLVLDKLAEKFSQNDKNLFEQIVDDVKKVSIKSEEAPGSQRTSSAGVFISEFGPPLSNWTWNWGSEAGSKLLASASQVTSQVGSVLDSVVNVSSHPFSQQSDRPKVESSVQSTGKQKDEVGESTSRGKSTTMGALDAASSDALADFTLNAMESLGKKAFSVLTERNESGSLQIKGLGRPWENFMPSRQSSKLDQRKDSTEIEHEPEETSSSQIETYTIRSGSDEPVTLKNRKKRFNPDE